MTGVNFYQLRQMTVIGFVRPRFANSARMSDSSMPSVAWISAVNVWGVTKL